MYTFIGWDKDHSSITESLTVTAQYSINSYTVTFEDFDGNEISTEEVEYLGDATVPTNPVRP